MMKEVRYSMLLVTLFLVIITFYGCNENGRSRGLGENEYYIGERLASLSADADSTFWIGGETGKAWHIDGNRVTGYVTGTDRIYKIATSPGTGGDTTCWLGVRNSGLQEWRLRDGNMTHERTYDILFKRGNYSAYDFSFTRLGLFTATSQGLYLLHPNHEFELLYPSKNSATAQAGMPFIIYNLCLYEDRYLFAASIGGLLRIDLRSKDINVLHAGENIQHVTTYDHQVYAVADKSIYIDTAEGTTLKKVKLGFTPHLYYKVGKVHYLLRSHSIVVSEDLKTFLNIPLRRDIPMSSRNVMLPDERSGFTLLVTENAFWRIPFHSEFFNEKGAVIAACANDHEAYYLNSQNELFRQVSGDSTAVKIFSLPKDEQVSRMSVTNGRRLYYVSGRSELRSADITGSNLKNELFSHIKTLYHSKERITALHIVDSDKGIQAYIGVQDGLVTLDDRGKADTVRSLADRYITAFASSPNTGSIYMSTMDAGIVYGTRDNYRTIPHSERMTFIRDFFVTDGYSPSLTVLTNHAIVMPDRQDTLLANGFSRLIPVNDTIFYAVPEFGVRKYVVRNGSMHEAGHYYDDIHFHAQSSFRMGNEIGLISSIGVLRMEPGLENQPSHVSFDTRVASIRFVLIVLLSLLGTGSLVFWIRYRQRTEQRRQTSLRIMDLMERTRGMSAMATLLGPDEWQSIRHLLQAVSSISAEDGDADRKIRLLSKQIMHKNRDWALQLSKVLETQIQEIGGHHAYDCGKLVNDSRAALEQDSISQISEQVTINKQWLEQYKLLVHDIRKYSSSVERCLLIEGVNDTMPRYVRQLQEELRNRPVADMQTSIEAAESAYRNMSSPDARKKIIHTLNMFREEIAHLPSDPVQQAMQEEIGRLEDHFSDALSILQEMKRTESLVRQMKIRRNLQEEMERYRQKREAVVRDNNRRVNRKFDMQLEVEIADHTQAETERIEQLITEFYGCFVQTDSEVVSLILNFSNFANQQARVLALLIADAKVKRTLLPGMIGIYGNLNPVISRLVNNKIKPHEQWLRSYTDAHPSSMANYILKLAM